MQNLGYLAYGKSKGIGMGTIKRLEVTPDMEKHKPLEAACVLEPVDEAHRVLLASPYYLGIGQHFPKGTPQDSRDHMVYQYFLFQDVHQEILKYHVYKDIVGAFEGCPTEDQIKDPGFDPRKKLAGIIPFPEFILPNSWKPLLFQAIQMAAAGKRVLITSKQPAWNTLILQILSAKYCCAINADFFGLKKHDFMIAFNCEHYKAEVLIDDSSVGITPEKGFTEVFDTLTSLSEFLYYADAEKLATTEGFYEAVTEHQKYKEYQELGIGGVLSDDSSWQQLGVLKKTVFAMYRTLYLKDGYKEAVQYLNKVQGCIREEIKACLKNKKKFSDEEFFRIAMLLFLAFCRVPLVLDYVSETWQFPFHWKEIGNFLYENASTSKVARQLEESVQELYFEAVENGGAEWIVC